VEPAVSEISSDIVNTFLLVFAGLFPIVNPLGSAPIFLSLTADCTTAEREALARHIAINGFCLLLGSLFVGSWILEFFGISLGVVRIAGGLVVTAMGWRLLNNDDSHPDRHAARVAGATGTPRDSFYPLTMPLTVGPGSISVAVTIGSRRPEVAFGVTHAALLIIAAVASLLAICLTVYIAYRFAGSIARVLGPGGVNVLVRLSAFILMCIGIEIIWNGYTALANTGAG
jgi:multiple antibiotic resistance protein